MSVFVSDERFKVDSLLQMARLEGDSKKRDEYVREAKEILKSVGRNVGDLSEEELRAKRKTDFAKARLLKWLDKNYCHKVYHQRELSRDDSLSAFEDWFCRERGTIKVFLDKAIRELEKDDVIAIEHKILRNSEQEVYKNQWITERATTVLDIHICDAEAAQWYL